jgi:phosphoribosylamine--glycine ligase
MKALVIGSGGREHAIVWRLAQSRLVDKIFCCPGNAGIAEIAECIDADPLDFQKFIDLVRYEWIDLTIVGPELPLAKGIVDAFQREGLRVFGPNSAAARLESSKVFAKEFMKRHKIPTADYRVFNSLTQAEEYLRMKGAPIVVKADGLAAGKGVFVAKSLDEALHAVRLMLKERIFGDAADRVVIEEHLEGEEASFMVLTDGNTIVPMASSQDHKRVYDRDEGPNTGGMGAYSPAPIVTNALEEVVMRDVIYPTINGLKSEGITYKGVLYAGLMIKDQRPFVLEFNCRLGDPETQPVLCRLESDLLDIAKAVTEGRLHEKEVRWGNNASVCVVLASKGYPGEYEKEKPIEGLDRVKSMKDVVVFHAGTDFKDGRYVTKGGRVLGVTAIGSDIATARQRAYEAVGHISFEGMHYRRDIAMKALQRP